jgi:hypothetical protein
MDFDDIVTVKVRTGKAEEFMYDGAPISIDAKKGKKLNRFMAERAVAQNALKWNKESGAVVEAKVYIEEDIGTPQALPSKPVTEAEIKVIKMTDGLGKDKILVDGKFVSKVSINLDPKLED